jgi:hypothetical protein
MKRSLDQLRVQIREHNQRVVKSKEDVEPGGNHVFQCDDDDHAETPAEAYEDLEPFLAQLAQLLGKDRNSLVIYDPYYCNGQVKRLLGTLGFSRVINENEDCYANWDKKEFDVVVTNPPYSGDHMERMCQWLSKVRKPFAFVVPNFVVKKPYHRELIEPLRPFFIVPRARYVYLPPKGFRSKKKSDTQKKTAPWMSIWHCYGGQQHVQVLSWVAKREWNPRVRIAKSRNALRDLRRAK